MLSYIGYQRPRSNVYLFVSYTPYVFARRDMHARRDAPDRAMS
jgi:hypothetical protein